MYRTMTEVHKWVRNLKVNVDQNGGGEQLGFSDCAALLQSSHHGFASHHDYDNVTLELLHGRLTSLPHWCSLDFAIDAFCHLAFSLLSPPESLEGTGKRRLPG